MNKLKTGYYSYNAKHGIYYLGNIVEIKDFPRDTVFITPSEFHQAISMYTFSEILITYFNECDELLVDLFHSHSIGVLHDA